MPYCPKCGTATADGELCPRCAGYAPSQVPWQWYWQLASVVVLAFGAIYGAGFVVLCSVFTYNNELLSTVVLSVLVAILAALGGLAVGRQWTPLWICVGWLIPPVTLFCLAILGEGYTDGDLRGIMEFAALIVLGSMSTIIGRLIRMRRNWLFAIALLPCLLLAISLLWEFADPYC